jgi:LytS/YehU family sensor histidine kinase
LALQQLEALRMQLNPHFLFNALNSVTELMEADVRRAQRTLSAVSDLLRLSLRSASQPTIPLWQEIELVERYLHVARVRYGDGLTIEIEIDPATVDIEVPSFVLQPLLENALKHGLQPEGAGQTVRVEAVRQGSMLQLRVTDNGRGLDGSVTDSGRFLAARPSVDGLGIGLTNTRARLALLYGDRYAFRMSQGATGGCTVELRVPVAG